MKKIKGQVGKLGRTESGAGERTPPIIRAGVYTAISDFLQYLPKNNVF